MEEKIKQIIDVDVNPLLKLHSGSCEFVALNGDVVTLRLNGGCVGCPSSKLTLLNGIIPIFKEKLPEIKDIELA
jgi:Fe/S biogenesis protein NfuA